MTEHVPLNPKYKNDDWITRGYIRLQNPNTSGIFIDAPPFSLNCKTLPRYQQNNKDDYGKRISAVMLPTVIENNTDGLLLTSR